MAGAQLGKSEAILNIIGYHIENDPSPILVLQPTVEMAQSFSKDRVANGLIRSTPCLREKVKDPRSRDSGNTTLHKVFPGGALTLVGANSPAGLASRPIRLVLCDEVDRYPTSAGSEGDPIQLARKRANTFWNRKIVMVSTPTNKGASRIEEAFEESDRRHFYVPCKHCHHEQKLRWQNVRWEEDDPDSAAYMCSECGVLWSDSDRRWAIRNGRWLAEAEFKGVAGFYINGLYSPWTPLSDGVRDFLSMKKNPEQLRVWTNTYLGESWEDQGETVDDFSLYERREDFEEAIPEEVVFLTAGVDVQDNRLAISGWGWGRDEEGWLVYHQEIFGDPSRADLWKQVDEAVLREWEHASGAKMRPDVVCCDSGGHFTAEVYQYARERARQGVIAIKGASARNRPVIGKGSRVDINAKGKTMKRGAMVFSVGTDTAKSTLFARLKHNEPGEGYLHFPVDVSDEYFQQLTAEKQVMKYTRGGFPVREWVKKANARNESLDTLVYAYAGLQYLYQRRDRRTIWDQLERRLEEPEKAPLRSRKAAANTAGSFVNNW